jgi:hypothetical protein
MTTPSVNNFRLCVNGLSQARLLIRVTMYFSEKVRLRSEGRGKSEMSAVTPGSFMEKRGQQDIG